MKPIDIATHRPANAFGRRAVASGTGLHEQLEATKAAAAHARRGYALRIALGFAAFGLAATFWSVPNVEDTLYRAQLAWQGGASDDLTTASIAPAPRPGAAGRRPGTAAQRGPLAEQRRPGRYVVRRSVLQAPGEVCIVGANGASECR